MKNKILHIFLSVGIFFGITTFWSCSKNKHEDHQGHQQSQSVESKSHEDIPYTPVITPNGETLVWEMKDGAKVFHLTVEEIEWEMAPGMKIKAWGYNGRTPGPTIEVVEGDHVKIYVTNKLPEATAVHWHGIILPSGMDGVKGLNQKGIKPGETFLYEFTLKQHGTQMYHSHGDEMTQMGMGAMGFFIIHPKKSQKIDRDYAIFLNEWFVPPGGSKPNPSVMTDFNTFTFNSRVFPGTAPLVAQTGEKVRIRFANVGQESHPIHLHGHSFKIVATDGGDIPASAQWPETTAVVFPGQTRDVEFIANPGDWAFHCHRRHHPMNAMGHGLPNLLGVNQNKIESDIKTLVPDYMAMGEKGMDEHEMHAKHMPGPENTIPMMGGEGPFGGVGMGGMFTILKVRDHLKPGDENGFYDNPPGTVASIVEDQSQPQTQDKDSQQKYTCPMHPEVVQDKPGKCPKCGMDLVPVQKDSIDSMDHTNMKDMKMDDMKSMDHTKMKDKQNNAPDTQKQEHNH